MPVYTRSDYRLKVMGSGDPQRTPRPLGEATMTNADVLKLKNAGFLGCSHIEAQRQYKDKRVEGDGPLVGGVRVFGAHAKLVLPQFPCKMDH